MDSKPKTAIKTFWKWEQWDWWNVCKHAGRRLSISGYELSVKLFVRVRLFCSDKYEVLQRMPMKVEQLWVRASEGLFNCVGGPGGLWYYVAQVMRPMESTSGVPTRYWSRSQRYVKKGLMARNQEWTLDVQKNIEKLIKFRLFVFIVQNIQRLIAWCIYFT